MGRDFTLLLVHRNDWLALLNIHMYINYTVFTIYLNVIVMCSLHIHHATYNNGTFCTLFILPIKNHTYHPEHCTMYWRFAKYLQLRETFQGQFDNFSSEKIFCSTCFTLCQKKKYVEKQDIRSHPNIDFGTLYFTMAGNTPNFEIIRG